MLLHENLVIFVNIIHISFTLKSNHSSHGHTGRFVICKTTNVDHVIIQNLE